MTDGEFIEKLLELNGLFDVGCSIHCGDDGICIEGMDYHPAGNRRGDQTCVERTYDIPYRRDDVTDAMHCDLNLLVGRIKEDTARIAESYK